MKLEENDPRLQATFGYSIHDDGVWLTYGNQEVSLGFWATLEDALLEAEGFKP